MGQHVPQATQTCYEHLASAPFRRIPGRVFPLRGKVFRGLWEYEVTGSERLYYLPDAAGEPAPPVGEGDEPPGAGNRSAEGERLCFVLACGGHITPPSR
jgi:hypothetical protein